MSKNAISGCFYLDSCVLLSEILRQNESRMAKLRADVKNHDIACYVAEGVTKECKDKIKETTDFLGDIFKKTIVAYLEGPLSKRNLSQSKPSNADLHIMRDAFLAINSNARQFDLISDPFQAIEEWIVVELEKELAKPTGKSLEDLLVSLTATTLKEITNLESDFERIVEFEAEYVKKSNQVPDKAMSDLLFSKGIHNPDCIHISVAFGHCNRTREKAVFLTFDYRTIIRRWFIIKRLSGVMCCDPIYGLSYLR